MTNLLFSLLAGLLYDDLPQAQVIKYFAIEGSNVDSSDALNNVVEFLVIAITIVVVAVPEGLPLAVTISLAYSMMWMMKDNNLVRRLEACETMGGATTVCSDKTGTLTQNKMTVVQGRIAGKCFSDSEPLDLANLSDESLRLVAEGIAVNSSAFKENGAYVGSTTECALLYFVEKNLRTDADAVRKATDVVEIFPFSSKSKRMATAVRENSSSIVLHVKGASELVLGMCSQVCEANFVVPLDVASREALEAEIQHMAEQGLRTLAIAYRRCISMTVAEDWTNADEPNLVLLGFVGIQDPLRVEVAHAVLCCQSAGVVVRMVTGDNPATALNIARRCHIVSDDQDTVFEGSYFRHLTDQQRVNIAPKLRVLARSSPTDKLLLVGALQSMGEVVAVTGDGVNDGPALKNADVGFSMGIAGTEVAKEASDIVLLDDNFASIVNAIKWGRNVFDNVRKVRSRETKMVFKE